MLTPKNCRCGLSNKFQCKNCSVVRMVIGLKNNNDHLKYERNGNLNNPVWYSFLKYNRYDPLIIAEKMEYRVRNHETYGAAAQVLLFYINGQRGAYFHKVIL